MAPGLDPDAQLVLDVLAAAGEPHLSDLPVPQARERVRSSLVTRRTPQPLHSVRDTGLPSPAGELRVRLYRPAEGRLPIALFLHGGGWTLNDLDTHDALCRQIAERSGWVLASLEYRKAPEHPHPAPLQDAYVAYRWLLDAAESVGCDPARRAVIGESSGASIAANLAVLLRDLRAPMPSFQVLAYPATDSGDRWPSYRERGSGYILDARLMRWYFAHHLPDGWRRQDPYLLPLAASDLSGLPPTLLLTAEFDPLRDEGMAYAERLRDAGVAVQHVHASDQMHGFLLLGRVVPATSGFVERIARALARAGETAGHPAAA